MKKNKWIYACLATMAFGMFTLCTVACSDKDDKPEEGEVVITPEPEVEYYILGTVTEAGKGVSNVDVKVNSETVKTDAEGKFSFTELDFLIEALKKRYDYIVMDNVPALVIADAAIVNRVADVTIYVMREGVIDRRYLPELERLHQEGKFKRMCVVLNGVHDKTGKYGYGYGYGYGYYSEDGKHKQKINSRKSLFKKLFAKFVK